MIKWHLMAFILGIMLDLLIGDPHFLPHPIRLMGRLIAALDRRFEKRAKTRIHSLAGSMALSKEGKVNLEKDKGKTAAIPRTDTLGVLRRKYGCLMVTIVIVLTGIASFAVIFAGYAINPIAGCIVEAILTCYILAGRQLQKESMAVCKHLKNGDRERARKAVSMIVGRDTSVLDEKGIAKAAVETVAENASDGVIAPMIYTAIGGPVLGFIYKAINTMDSMVGYKNEKYIDFGRWAAKLDDVVNYIPARICALLMIAAAFFLGGNYSGKNALKIYKRDRKKGSGPNPAQCESVCAGALGIRLAGPTIYGGGMVKKPYLGDALRPIEADDINRTNTLMLMTGLLCGIICIVFMGIFM